ncbi:MAG: hypothetical protein NTV28_00015 [Propionibacteriales bacterium]|nr:hypothetical protein [Propionibacteriales bacterium]
MMLLNIWVSSIGAGAFVMIWVVGGITMVAETAPGSPLEWCIYGLVLIMVVDAVGVTIYKILTGADRRRAISSAWDAYDHKDYAAVMETLEPHKRDLSYVDYIRYLRAKDLLRRSNARQSDSEG